MIANGILRLVALALALSSCGSSSNDPDRQVTVLFGGGELATDRVLKDTWEYTPAAGWRRVAP